MVQQKQVVPCIRKRKRSKSLCQAKFKKIGRKPFVTQDSALDKTSEELNIIVKSDVHGSSENKKCHFTNKTMKLNQK